MAAVTVPEQETICINNMGEDFVRIYSCVARDITKLERHPGVTIVREGRYGRTRWIEATVPMGQWSPTSGVKRQTKRVMTEEQRLAAGERLKKAREAR